MYMLFFKYYAYYFYNDMTIDTDKQEFYKQLDELIKKIHKSLQL